jgi:hypothetical protein
VKGYRQLLRWAALPVTDRRWAAPLSAVALGFGLFVGVAIGPGAAGTLATGVPQVIELPGFSGGDEEEVSGEGGGGSAAIASTAGGSSGSESAPMTAGSSSTEFVPSAFDEAEAPLEPAPESEPAVTEAPPPAEETTATEVQTLAGVVVHVNPQASSYALAEAGGTLDAIHAAKLPAPGTKLSVLVRLLANGTFAEAGKRKQAGRQARASFDGIVTFVDPDPMAPVYAVSKRGASVLVHVRPDPTRAVSPLPALGAYATVAVEIETAPSVEATSVETEPPVAPEVEAPAPPPGCVPDPGLVSPPPATILWQRQIEADGAPFAYADFAGVVTGVCGDEAKLLLSADDSREAGTDLALSVPEEIDTSKLEPGQSVVATATIEVGGALTLTGLASNERTKGADDVKTTQGDLVPSNLK